MRVFQCVESLVSVADKISANLRRNSREIYIFIELGFIQLLPLQLLLAPRKHVSTWEQCLCLVSIQAKPSWRRASSSTNMAYTEDHITVAKAHTFSDDTLTTSRTAESEDNTEREAC